ncbi:hypothetical protein P1T63_23990 [Escherichia coli]|nr:MULTISPECIES: hypothetical protein [Enterobacteriaceae]EET3009556.1 hypothetical protein [Escherichia coli]EFA4517088.1 hypothetical protein [Escherichia coli]EFA6870313.1 hypothetical protein [Escherichia coli]EFB1790510.1 hypothetical protein [Escherichia coli]EFB1836912.1 hypothetical protein [Escherichia coli]
MTKIAFWINIVQSARPNPATSHQPPATSHQPGYSAIPTSPRKPRDRLKAENGEGSMTLRDTDAGT